MNEATISFSTIFMFLGWWYWQQFLRIILSIFLLNFYNNPCFFVFVIRIFLFLITKCWLIRDKRLTSLAFFKISCKVSMPNMGTTNLVMWVVHLSSTIHWLSKSWLFKDHKKLHLSFLITQRTRLSNLQTLRWAMNYGLVKESDT